jgi:hypothetical protein
VSFENSLAQMDIRSLDLLAVIRFLDQVSSRDKKACLEWHLQECVTTAMHGSGQKHLAWVLRR